jgi:hypothetical protein
MNLVSRDLLHGGSPPSPPGYCHMTGQRDHVTGHVIARPEFSNASTVPTPRLACVWGGGPLWALPMSQHGRHLNDGGLGTMGPSPLSHIQTSYAGTRDNTQQRSYMPSTIIVARGLLSPMPLFSVAFYCHGGKG